MFQIYGKKGVWLALATFNHSAMAQLYFCFISEKKLRYSFETYSVRASLPYSFYEIINSFDRFFFTTFTKVKQVHNHIVQKFLKLIVFLKYVSCPPKGKKWKPVLSTRHQSTVVHSYFVLKLIFGTIVWAEQFSLASSSV